VASQPAAKSFSCARLAGKQCTNSGAIARQGGRAQAFDQALAAAAAQQEPGQLFAQYGAGHQGFVRYEIRQRLGQRLHSGTLAGPRRGGDIAESRLGAAIQYTLLPHQPAELGDPSTTVAVIGGQLGGELALADRHAPKLAALRAGRHADSPGRGAFAARLNAALMTAQGEHGTGITWQSGNGSAFPGTRLEAKNRNQLAEQKQRPQPAQILSGLGGSADAVHLDKKRTAAQAGDDFICHGPRFRRGAAA
jgi:hypothetical protein